MKKKKTNEIVMYTTETCGYCTELKKQFKEKKVKYIEKPKEKYEQDWYKKVDSTGLALLPTIVVNNTNLIPGRDFQNPEQLVNVLETFKKSSYNESKRTFERMKTLNYHMNTAFGRLDQLLRQIETKINKEDEHKSTS